MHITKENIIDSNIVINSSLELTPVIRISPFRLNSNIDSNLSVQERSNIFSTNNKYVYTKKCRNAIGKALELFKLYPNDEVTILTTSGNKYVSGCVTKEIEKFCLWNRSISTNTKVIFVIHEFGYAYENLSELKKYGLPIIEDCAYSFFSQNKEMSVGQIGDFVVYSLPKIFPMQCGGILLNNNTSYIINQQINNEESNYINNLVDTYVKKKDYIILKRRENHKIICDKLTPLGIEPYFQETDFSVPGVSMLKWGNNINYTTLKNFLQRNGVESSVFYGENAFFVPCNDSLSIVEIDYICKLIKYFYKHEL